ncbi:MAG: hypothetical protein R3D86_07495 [Emcibacteraceae bacterium]
MSEITQPPPDVHAQDPNARVNRLSAASDQSTSKEQSADKQTGKTSTETEKEKVISHHDPAVTLASTLAKLDSGSRFSATVNGQDADGRTVITSELGTYLVNVDQKFAAEIKQLKPDTPIEIRVITVDKEIKAEIIESSQNNTTSKKPVPIPVSLTLTEIAGQNNPVKSPVTPPAETRIADIRSQYQATTLYKAERIAREIGDKLDNLPLPTTSPNYTVYGALSPNRDAASNLAPRQVSSNVFIQEISPDIAAGNGTANPSGISASVLEQLLGKNIPVQVIKAVPRTDHVLPAGLPEAVIKELNALTPLDYVSVGQNLKLNIAAIAIPEENNFNGPQAEKPAGLLTQNTSGQTEAVLKTALEATPDNIVSRSSVLEGPHEGDVKQGINDTVISGIIIDTARNINKDQNPASAAQANRSSAILYGQSLASTLSKKPDLTDGNNEKTYYLATPTSVLKFQSHLPLIPGTIVSFTVEKNSPAHLSADHLTDNRLPLNPETTTSISEQPSAINVTSGKPTSGELPLNPLTTQLSNRIENFLPQTIDQLQEDWGSLGLALSTLQGSASTAEASAFLSRIPAMQNPGQLTSGIIFFLSAINAVHPARVWLGPEVSDRLKQVGAEKIIDRIGHDFTRIAQMATDRPTAEWRPYLVPIHNGSDISAVPILIKQISNDDRNKSKKDQENEESQKVKATRFMLEIKFSRFGMVHLDGLLKGKTLDIILKAANTIPFAVKTKLSQRYNDALKQNDFSGELIINDNALPNISVKKIFESLSINKNFEKRI